MHVNKMTPQVGVLATLLAVGGCAGNPKAAAVRPVPAPAAPPIATPAPDPVPELIAAADKHLATGIELSSAGHTEQARDEFDQAIDSYLSYPGGATADPRLEEAYRRTVEAIHKREVATVAESDALKEGESEPAAIDEVSQIPLPETAPSEETRRVAQEEVAAAPTDFPVELNDRVLNCVELYQGRLHDWFQAALDRGAPYLPHIRETLASEGLPQDLAYVALVESAFHTGALSRSKAKGVWQFIADTGRRYGLRQDFWVDERSNPEKATVAAARYLKTLHGMFSDWNLALAGYNAGEGRIVRAMNQTGIRDFWTLAQRRLLRQETRNYVPLIHAAILVARSPERYGFTVPQGLAPAAETVSVAGAIELRLLADCAGSSLDELRRLNPELRRPVTPANRTYDVRVPAGSVGVVQDCLTTGPAQRRAQFRTHVVGRGQTLGSISRLYGTSPSEIASANGFAVNRRLPVGTDLIIPVGPRPIAVPASRSAAVDSDEKSGPIRYRIRPGDTLSSIAQQYGTSVERIRSWNGLKNSRIAAGRTLTIYTQP